MKNQTVRRSSMLGMTMALMLLMSSVTLGQSVGGRIAFGIDAGGNKYYGNFTDNQFAFHGDAFIRWNILDWLSLHAAYNAGQLKYKATAAEVAYEGPFAGEVGSLNHTRVGGWDLMLSYNVFPEETFVPYVIAGVEALNFEPKNAGDNSLRQTQSGDGTAISKNVFGFVAGVGFEMYISDKITFNGKGLIHLPSTDYLDDYSTSPTGDATHDAFLTMGLGFSYYIFAPMIVHDKDVDHGNTTNVTNIYTTNIIKADTVIVRETDTVYRTKAVKGTIYNFPGTLFIVNTDEFNTAVPGNMQNLRNIKTLVNQCPNLKVEIQGHASHEGTVERNHELSHMRATKIKNWLIEQGVSPDKIAGTSGLGTSDDAVHEPENATPAQLEAARILNRRISVKVVEGCN